MHPNLPAHHNPRPNNINWIFAHQPDFSDFYFSPPLNFHASISYLSGAGLYRFVWSTVTMYLKKVGVEEERIQKGGGDYSVDPVVEYHGVSYWESILALQDPQERPGRRIGEWYANAMTLSRKC
jgi:hypothetical protein